MTDAIVTCDARAHDCRCVLPVGHHGDVHVCDAGCGGCWIGDIDGGDFVVVSYPSGRAGLPR